MDVLTVEDFIHIDKEDVGKINRLFKWYDSGIMKLLHQFKQIKEKRIKSKKTAINNLETVRSLSLKIEEQSKSFMEHVNNMLMQLNISASTSSDSDENSLILVPKSKLCGSSSIKKKISGSSIFIDVINGESFVLNEQKQLKENNSNNGNKTKLNVLVDDYLLTFKRQDKLDRNGVNIVNEEDETVPRGLKIFKIHYFISYYYCCFTDNSFFKNNDGDYKINFYNMRKNEMLKISFNNVQCIVKKNDVCNQDSQETFNPEQNLLRCGKDFIKNS